MNTILKDVKGTVFLLPAKKKSLETITATQWRNRVLSHIFKAPTKNVGGQKLLGFQNPTKVDPLFW